jgi:hypothetical protein
MYAKHRTPVETDGVVDFSLVGCTLFNGAPSTHRLFGVAELKTGMEKSPGTYFEVL